MKIGLALGSGGPKGLSHIGVIKVLNENGIYPSVITGSSIGALIGGAYAKLGDINEVERIALSSDMKTVLSVLFDPTIKMGVVKGKKVVDFLENNIGDAEISSLVPKFFPVATDFHTGEPFIFEKGSLILGIRWCQQLPNTTADFRELSLDCILPLEGFFREIPNGATKPSSLPAFSK